ncbi:unnamed protein product, partial [Taenia asiatica]|uniref:Calpain catalytic domain-containing protein n=1 Tax=Taenia asiatica TaxID=60517 RepID=A0A0R3WHE5_TAEAS
KDDEIGGSNGSSGGGSDESSAEEELTFQEQGEEEQKQRLRFQQNRLSDCSAVAMVLLELAASKGEATLVALATVKLGIAILLEGNASVQIRMLAYLAEKPFQDCLRTQSSNTTSMNLIICTVDYLLRLQESIMDFYWHFSNKPVIDDSGRKNFIKAKKMGKNYSAPSQNALG